MLPAGGGYISGEEISKSLNISRTAVWKYINKLRADGYIIKSVTNRGYALLSAPDIINAEEIQNTLSTTLIGKKIFYTEKTDSTNNEAKRHSGAPNGSVFISEIQTNGRGRRGRTWQSEKGFGIYMSILQKPDIAPYEVSKITLLSGLAVAKALKKTGLDVGIKWPNDIVIGGKKICGILTELSAEADSVGYVVTGIGINVNNASFPTELIKTATSVFLESGKITPRAAIIRSVLEEIEPLYELFLAGSFELILREYKALCVTLLKDIKVITPAGEYFARALDILPSGALLAEAGSEKKIINSGEVSVRGIGGYV